MTSAISSRIRYVLFSAAVAIAVTVSLLTFLSSSLEGLTSVERAVLVEGGARSDVDLPRFWRAENSEVTSTTFELQFDSRDFSLSLDDTYFFLPFFEQRVFLRVNGAAIDSADLESPRYSPLAYSYALVKAPTETLREGMNRVEIRVETGPGRIGALPSLYIGPLDSLQLPYSLFSFATFELRIVLLGAELILAFFSVLMFLGRREDAVYGWLSAALVGSILSSVSIFADLFPALEVFTLSTYFLLPTSALSVLGFALTFSGIRRTRWIVAAIIILPALGVFLNVALGISPDVVYLYLTAPSLVVPVGLAGILILLTSLRIDNNHADILFISLLVIAIAVAYDTGVRVGLFATGIPISVFARFFVLIGVIIYLMRRWMANARALDLASQELQDKLDAREKSLREVFASQQLTLEKFAKSEERQRITAELHDGVAGHLITILALVDAEQQDREPIRKTTRVALEELRTVIDMLVVSNTNLEFTLASFREKCLEPLVKLGIDVTFDVGGLTEDVDLSPIESLNLFRLLQEATTNAVRHGKPSSIAIRAQTRDGLVELSVENSGGEALGDYAEGFGLRNMRKRSQSLRECSVRLAATASGATLSVRFSAAS